jgi:hypothetical protein
VPIRKAYEPLQVGPALDEPDPHVLRQMTPSSRPMVPNCSRQKSI